jgi:hypothetical protein
MLLTHSLIGNGAVIVLCEEAVLIYAIPPLSPQPPYFFDHNPTYLRDALAARSCFINEHDRILKNARATGSVPGFSLNTTSILITIQTIHGSAWATHVSNGTVFRSRLRSLESKHDMPVADTLIVPHHPILLYCDSLQIKPWRRRIQIIL